MPMMQPLLRLAAATAVLLAGAALAQTSPAPPPAPTPAPPPAPSNCAAAEYRQLDFWVGEWRVFRQADGLEVATSTIARIANGCGISEHYIAPGAPGGPYEGLSYSSFDRREGKWRQFYVDVNGNATWYTGQLEGTVLALYAPGVLPGVQQRMSYTPNADGSVNQTGVISSDGGKTWQPGYDYVYRRR